MAVKEKLAKFVVAGGVGFAVDAGLLWLLLEAGLPSLPARLLSLALALLTTWRINRRFAFRTEGRGSVGEFAKYLSVGLSTSVLNYLSFAALVVLAQVPPLVALAAASLLALTFSFLGYDRFVFGERSSKE